MKSKSKLIISHINNLPDEVELHDIGIIFSVLTHIRDPYTALLRMCSHVNEKIVITELGGYSMRKTLFNTIPRLYRIFKEKFIKEELPYMRFLPNNTKQGAAWWAFNKETIIMMLKLLGFEKTIVTYHDYKDKNGKKVFQWTVTGERTVPIDKCDYDYDHN
jgi:hypothetical protein